jgi:hypothetical protein
MSMSPEFADGLTVVAVVAIATAVICPVLAYILPDRSANRA